MSAMAGRARSMRRRRGVPALAGVGIGLLASDLARRRRGLDLRGRVALVTGGSRGLGLLIARELGAAGCQIAICARDDAELHRAVDALARTGARVVAVRADVADRADAGRVVGETVRRLGRLDVLVNNAGVITVGPFETMTEEDFRQALDVMFWGVLHMIRAALPHLRTAGDARIVNVTSIGGKVAVPHLLPYVAAKFAAVGLSEGLRAELRGTGVRVVTVVPGLMRTGSHVQAQFKGRREQESVWFSLGATLPLVSMDAERAARAIVRAARRGDAEVTLGLPARVLARVHGMFPGATAELLGLVNRLVLPAPDGGRGAERGADVLARVRSPLLDAVTRLGRSAARRFQRLETGKESAA